MPDGKDRLAIVSDEAAESFGDAVAMCLPLGIRAYELRKLPGGRVPYVDAQAIEDVLETVRRHSLQLVGISPGFFKGNIEDHSTKVQISEGFDHAFRLMDRLSVRRMTVFSFRRTAPEAAFPSSVIEHLQRAAELCRNHGVEMLIENIAGNWADTGEHLAQLARATETKATWDPANAAASGEIAYPNGYDKVKDFIAHLHCKNWRPRLGDVNIRDGIVNMNAQIAALKADRYGGYYCLEPHQRNDRANVIKLNAEQLLQILHNLSANIAADVPATP